MPDYLEQKRVKNKGVHSEDLWRRKMRCQCGHAFAKTKWHTKTDFLTYTYKCYDQTRTGTIAARLKNGLGIENVCRSLLVQDWKMYTMAQKVLHAVFDDPEGTLLDAAAVLGCSIAGVEQSEVLRDKEVIEEQLKKERGRYETLLDMRMNNEIPKAVFSRKQQEVGERIAELEQRMAQYGDVKPATEADVSGKLENLQKLMGQFAMPDDERAWFRKHQQWSKNKSILSSSPEYMSDLRRIAWYSPSLLTIPFMTLCMRVSMNWYNAESFSNPIPPLCGVVA